MQQLAKFQRNRGTPGGLTNDLAILGGGLSWGTPETKGVVWTAPNFETTELHHRRTEPQLKPVRLRRAATKNKLTNT